MKSNITKRLVIYFLIVIIAFSLISSIIMFLASRSSLERNYIANLEKRTEAISKSMTNALEYESEQTNNNTDPDLQNNGMRMRRGMGPNSMNMMRRGLGSNLLKWIEDFILNEVRVIYKDQANIEVRADKEPIKFNNLESFEKDIVEKAFVGKLEIRSIDKDKQTLIAVAAPLYNASDEIVGAILLNDQVDFTKEILSTAIPSLLISLLLGGLLVTLLALFFANRFIKPIKLINDSTKEMIAGNYKINNDLEQNDEIGHLSDNIDTLASRLEDARQQSMILDQMKDDFVSSMSHELKTPVTVMKSSLEVLNAGLITEDEEVKEYHRVLYKESEILDRLIKDLMDLNILRNAKFTLQKEDVNLIDILDDAIKSQGLMAKEKMIKIEKKFNDNYISFEGDYTRIRQMFTTIIDNAIKYSAENSKVLISEESNKTTSIIKVYNYNNKIDEKMIEHIFEAFYRDKNTKEKGFGLGLAIAKEIANHHDIELSVASSEEKTVFQFIFNNTKK